MPGLRGLLGSGHFNGFRRGRVDGDGPRLLRLGHLAYEVDVQEAVLDGRLDRAHVVGEVEPTLERARRNALIKHLALLALDLLMPLFGAADGQHALLRFDDELALAETRHGER